MNDADILNAFGLSEEDITDLINKYQSYLGSLNAAQLDAMTRRQPDPEKIAAAISPNCTVDDLNDFAAKRSKTALVPGAFSIPCPVDDDDDDED